jgi:hypothetical protein
MTPAMRDRRTANWKGIIRGLAIEHERVFHGPANALAFLGEAHGADNTCGIQGCAHRVKARGWCATHYQQVRRAERRMERVA